MGVEILRVVVRYPSSAARKVPRTGVHSPLLVVLRIKMRVLRAQEQLLRCPAGVVRENLSLIHI